jgi:hypothetical protein
LLLPEATCGFAGFATPAVARLLVVGPPLEITQDPILQHDPLEEPDGAFHAAFADGHLQRAMMGPSGAPRGWPVSALIVSEAHESSPRQARTPPHHVKEKRHEAKVRAASKEMPETV